MQIEQENAQKEAALMTRLKDEIREVMDKFALEQNCAWKLQSLALREVASEVDEWGTNMDSVVRLAPDMPLLADGVADDQRPTTWHTD